MAALVGNTITLDGVYTVPVTPGVTYLVVGLGNYGGGTLLLKQIDSVTGLGLTSSQAVTAADSWMLYPATNTFQFTLTGSVGASIVLFVIQKFT